MPLAEVRFQCQQAHQQQKCLPTESAPCAYLLGQIQLPHLVDMSSAGSALLSGATKSPNVPCVVPLSVSLLWCVWYIPIFES